MAKTMRVITRDLKAILEKRDAPAGEDDFPKSFAAVFQMPYQARVKNTFEII